MAEEEISSDESTETVETAPTTPQFDAVYTCLRCNTNVSNSELSRLPEIKCICGFRVFTKVRSPIVKSIKAV